jgi:hypothetical protein
MMSYESKRLQGQREPRYICVTLESKILLLPAAETNTHNSRIQPWILMQHVAAIATTSLKMKSVVALDLNQVREIPHLEPPTT